MLLFIWVFALLNTFNKPLRGTEHYFRFLWIYWFFNVFGCYFFPNKVHLRYMYLLKTIVIRSRKIAWYFLLNFEFMGWPYSEYTKTAKNGCFQWVFSQWGWLWGCFSYFLLLCLWCKYFSGSSEDRYRWERTSQIPLVSFQFAA